MLWRISDPSDGNLRDLNNQNDLSSNVLFLVTMVINSLSNILINQSQKKLIKILIKLWIIKQRACRWYLPFDSFRSFFEKMWCDIKTAKISSNMSVVKWGQFTLKYWNKRWLLKEEMRWSHYRLSNFSLLLDLHNFFREFVQTEIGHSEQSKRGSNETRVNGWEGFWLQPTALIPNSAIIWDIIWFCTNNPIICTEHQFCIVALDLCRGRNLNEFGENYVVTESIVNTINAIPRSHVLDRSTAFLDFRIPGL